MIEVTIKGHPTYQYIETVEIEPRYMDAGFTVWMETADGSLVSADIESLSEVKIIAQHPG